MKSLKEVTENLSYLESRIDKFDRDYVYFDNDPYELNLTIKYFHSLIIVFEDIIRDFEPVVSDDCTEADIYDHHVMVARICRKLMYHLQNVKFHLM